MLVRADGLRSAVRAALFGAEPPHYLGASLRGIGWGVQLPDELAEGSLTIGCGVSVSSLPLCTGEHYWTAVVKIEPGTKILSRLCGPTNKSASPARRGSC